MVPAGAERCAWCSARYHASLEERDAAEVRWITGHTKALEQLQAGNPAGAAAAAEWVLAQSAGRLAEHHVVRHECRLVGRCRSTVSKLMFLKPPMVSALDTKT